jgi:hypothetical protein
MDVVDIISFEKDVLILWKRTRLQQRADPSYKSR